MLIKMKKIIIVFLVFLLLCSCDKNEEVKEEIKDDNILFYICHYLTEEKTIYNYLYYSGDTVNQIMSSITEKFNSEEEAIEAEKKEKEKCAGIPSKIGCRVAREDNSLSIFYQSPVSESLNKVLKDFEDKGYTCIK